METIDCILPEQMNTEPSVEEEINRIEGEINNCKALLLNTDWCVIKCQETGQRMEEVYPDESAARITARNQINDLQVALATLHEALSKENQSEEGYDNIL